MRLIVGPLRAITALVLAVQPVLGQSSSPAPNKDTASLYRANENPVLFLERAYFSPLTPTGKNLVFEGQPTAHYFLGNGLSNPDWQAGNRRWAVATSVSELFVVRMSNTHSEPVLTPSFHIGARMQFVRLDRSTTDPLDFRMINLMFGVIHYSNGQFGCTYRGSVRDSLGNCNVVDPALAAQRRTNTVSGDFSTTYFPVQAAWRVGRLLRSNHRLKWQSTVGIEAQYHPLTTRVMGVASQEQVQTYGQHEFSFFGEVECRRKAESGLWRIASRNTYRVANNVKPLARGSVEGSFVFEGKRLEDSWEDVRKIPILRAIRVRHAGLFARYNSGYDYYNIRYQDKRSFWSFGIILDPALLDGLDRRISKLGDIPVGRCFFPWGERE